MQKVAPDALVCDLAQTYHIYDYRALPARYVAILACGLGERSRTMRILSGNPYTFEQIMMASILDAVRMLVWMQSEDGAHGSNRPQSVVSQLLRDEDDIEGFSSAEDFEAAKDDIIGGGEGSGDTDW